MLDVLDEGCFRYSVDTEWGILPDGWSLGDVAAVGVDAKDDVYVFNRGDHPMIVFDRVGNLLRSWGEGVFKNRMGFTSGATASSTAPMMATTLCESARRTVGSFSPSAFRVGPPRR